MGSARFNTKTPLLQQLLNQGLELDQKLMRALEVSASRPNLDPEDVGFPDSYLTLALYRLNSVLSSSVTLDESRLNLFHDYKKAPPCSPTEVRPGNRLCRVLEKAVSLAGDGNTIGSGHFLRAVVSLTLDREAEPAWGFRSQVIHNTFSAETLLWGLGHNAWTPVADAPELQDLLRSLDGRSPVDDFQYLIMEENGRLVFRPTSLLDTFSIETSPSVVLPQSAVLTHLRDHYAGVTPDVLLELEDLINSPVAQERDLQRFFERNPQLLRLWDCRDVHPQVVLTREEDGPLIPDFLLVDPVLQRAIVLDLKRPSAKTVVRQKNRERFSALVAEARAQLLEYRDWFEQPANRQAMVDRLGMQVFRPRMAVLIGTADQFSGPTERQKLQSAYPDVEVVTYDDVRTVAERRLMLVKSAMR